VEEGNDQPPGDGYVYALKDEEAYLQRDEDEKPEIIMEPPDPSWFKCSFCRKTDRHVLFGAEYPVRDPHTFAVLAQIFICDECVARFAESLAQESGGPAGTVGRE
jgi:C4-type Zn-finger protein